MYKSYAAAALFYRQKEVMVLKKAKRFFFLPSLFVKMDGNFHNIKDGTR